MFARRFVVAATFTMLSASAFAQGRCTEPFEPVVPDGTTSTQASLAQANRDVVSYMRATQEYEQCLLAEFNAKEREAKDSKKGLDPSVRKTLDDKADALQAKKQRVGTTYNNAYKAFKAAHP